LDRKVKVKSEIAPVFKNHAMKTYRVCGGKAPHTSILAISGCESMFLPGRIQPYPLDRRLCGPQSRSELRDKEINLCRESNLRYSAHSLVTLLIELTLLISNIKTPKN
jgi:hypothetical protein